MKVSPGIDQQRALSADQQRMAELQRLLGKYGQVEIQDLMARLEQAEVRVEQVAADAARIVELERERDDAVAQSRIDCTAYEALQADAVAFAQRIERLEQALRDIAHMPCITELLGEDNPICWCASCHASAALGASHV